MKANRGFNPEDFKVLTAGKMRLATATFLRAAGLYRALGLPPGEIHIEGERVMTIPEFLEELGTAYRTERLKLEPEEF